MNSSPDGVGGTGEKRHLQNSVVVARPPRGASSPGPSRTPRPRGSARTPRSWPAGSPSWAARRGPEGLAVTLPELDRFVILQCGRSDDVLRRVARRRDHDICKQTRRWPRHGDLPAPASRWPRGRPRPHPADRPLPQPFPATHFQEVLTATSTAVRLSSRAQRTASRTGRQDGEASLAGSLHDAVAWASDRLQRGGRSPRSREDPALHCAGVHAWGLSRVVSLPFHWNPEPTPPPPPTTAGPTMLQGGRHHHKPNPLPWWGHHIS